MKMMQTLKFIGRGSAFNNKEINNSAYFEKDGVFVLIDCGKGVADAIINNNLLKDVKQVYVVITHTHNDHVADLPKFLDYCNDILKIKPNILQTISIENDAFEKLGLKEGRDFKFVEPISKNFKWINTLLVPHAKQVDTCALEIYFDGKKIFYSSDCKNIPFQIEGYDEYYLDCSENNPENHMDIEKIKEIIKKNKIKKQQVFLMHIESQRTIDMAREEGLEVVETIVTPELIRVEKKKKVLSRTTDRQISK